MTFTPGGIIHVNGDLVGSESWIVVQCLVVKVSGEFVHVRTKRYPTHAELERGDFDPWTKRVWKVPLATILKQQGDPHL
ncbi:MAG: hypothetical protein IT445_00155 [Phycisphaeraceae bacterium]|nr:hypothetical protein [Phycisphaeraceae bacterium]